jgi:hypothetical protein
MSIFISIASYRDDQLTKTVSSLFENASNKDDLFFGIVSQDVSGRHPKFPYIPYGNIKQKNIHARDAKGAGYARKLAMELYDGQDYFFQVDSHMRFVKDWDKKIIKMLEQAQKIQKSKKVILSQFPAPYNLLTTGEEYYPKGDPDFWDEPSWTSVVNTWQGVWAGNREKMKDKSKPHYSHTVLAGLLFAPGSIVKEIPYDERISFMGEELCFAIRAYTRGWHIYAPHEMIAWHFYKREDRPKIWKDTAAGRSWSDIEMDSQKVQMNVLLGKEKGVYGIGNKKKYEEYQELIGINFEKFYKEKMHDKVNLGTITQELNFDEEFNLIEKSMSGYCKKKMHKQCFAKEICDCSCHKKRAERK